MQLLVLFFSLPAAEVGLLPEVASVLARVINQSAYTTEIGHAGVEATPRGQVKAAESLALNRLQTYTRVVLPPALKKVWLALTSQIIIVTQSSARCRRWSISWPEKA